MSFARGLVLGLAALGLLALLPLALAGRSSEPAVQTEELLGIGFLNGQVRSEALRLRNGLTQNYDDLGAYTRMLREGCEELVERLEGTSSAAERGLLRTLCQRIEIYREMELVAIDFATHNASVRKAVASMPLLLNEVLSEPDLSPQTRDRLEQLHGDVLLLQTVEDPSLHEKVRADLDAWSTLGATASSQSSILRRNFEIATLERDVVDQKLHRLEELYRAGRIFEAIDHYQLDVSWAAQERTQRTLAIQTTSFLLAFGTCWVLCMLGWRQSRDLKREIAERQRASEEARQYEEMLRHAQKMESIG